MSKSKALNVTVMICFVLLMGVAFAGEKENLEPMAQQALTIDQKEKVLRVSVPFIENKGQYSKEVRFYAKTFGGTVFVNKDGEIVYWLPNYEEKTADMRRGLGDGKEKAVVTGGVALRERLMGADVKEIKGEGASETKVSYFVGSDPSRWRSGLKTYNLVSLGEVYEGVEVKLKAYGKNVEKLFYVKPGILEKLLLVLKG